MSYEKISGIRMNPDKNILEFKSHSNNDDAPASWWPVQGEMFVDKVVEVYLWWKDGIWQSNAKSGGLLALRYAFMKFSQMVKEIIGEEPEFGVDDYKVYCEKCNAYRKQVEDYINSHKHELLNLVLEKDTKPKYKGYIHGDCAILNVGANGIRYWYDKHGGKLFTRKQVELIQMQYHHRIDELSLRFEESIVL